MISSGIKKGIVLVVLACIFVGQMQAQRKANKEYELKAFARAIQSYLRYINQNPSNGEAMAKLADCYRHLNEIEEAEEWYERAFSAPQTVDPIHYLYYGKVLMSAEKYDLAAREFRRFAQISPEYGNHFYERAIYASRNRRRVSRYEIRPVEGVNTSASDFGPAFFQNNQIIYSSARLDASESSSSWTGKAKNQLFVAKADNNGLRTERLLRPQASNSRDGEGPVSYSSDGRTVVITRNNFVDGTRMISSSGMKLDLFIANVGFDGNWSEEEPFPWNGSDFSTGFGHLAADGNTLYFASDRPGGVGGFDIYVSYRTGTDWSPPELLPTTINTLGDEITPYFDGRTLYFASAWHDGYGGYDIFQSERNNQQWSVARNMGVGINSPRDDYGFVFDGIRNLGYFVSNRKEGRGNEDIYSVSRETNEVIVRVLNATDNMPLEGAVIDFSDCQKGIYATDANGIFNFRADEELNCRLLIRKQGYTSASLQLSGISIRDNKNYEIILEREADRYEGRIVDVDTRIPIEQMLVQATNQQTNIVYETYTNQDGIYKLPLRSNGSYTVRYSKMGYADRSRRVSVRDGGRNVLGILEMRRTGSSTPITPEIDPTPRPPAVTDLPEVGYAVQVSATNKLDLDQYAPLNVHGNVYYVKDRGLFKIRVGVYLSKSEANSIAQKLRSSGYRGAFLVEESMVNVSDKVIGEMTAPITTDDRSPEINSTNGYKVQLAAYKDPSKYFKESKVAGIGFVEQRRKGQLTIMLLSGYRTEQEARNALSKARRAGFTTAFLVYDQNGRLEKVN